MADQVDIHVGKRLRLRRTLLGMSQEKLAGILGVSFQQIQKYERGANRISASRLYDIAQVLNVEVPFFFQDIEQTVDSERMKTPMAGGKPSHLSEETEGPENRLENMETLEFVRNYWKIQDPLARRQIRELIEELAEQGDS